MALHVDLELRVDLSGMLFRALEAAELDLVLAQSRRGEDRGRLVRRERLIWIAADSALAEPGWPFAADPLSAAQHQPRDGTRSARTRRQKLAHCLHVRQPQRPQRRGIGRAWDMRPVRRLCAGPAFRTAAIVRIAGARPYRICRRWERLHLARTGECDGGGHSRQCRSAVRCRPPNPAAGSSRSEYRLAADDDRAAANRAGCRHRGGRGVVGEQRL